MIISWPDFINGAFESMGGAAIFLSVRQLYRDKKVRGFHWGQIAFFTAWGIWNMYYYPHLEQVASFLGAVGVTIMNVIYLSMVVYYKTLEKE